MSNNCTCSKCDPCSWCLTSRKCCPPPAQDTQQCCCKSMKKKPKKSCCCKKQQDPCPCSSSKKRSRLSTKCCECEDEEEEEEEDDCSCCACQNKKDSVGDVSRPSRLRYTDDEVASFTYDPSLRTPPAKDSSVGTPSVASKNRATSTPKPSARTVPSTGSRR